MITKLKRGAPTKEQREQIEKDTMLAYRNIKNGSKTVIEAKKLGVKPATLSQRFRSRNLMVRKNKIGYNPAILNATDTKYKGYSFSVNRNGDCIINYSISSSGRKIRARWLVFYEKSGYMQASLNRDGKCHTILQHRLIASAFCDDFSDELMVDHIDGNKTNNVADNLRMVTPLQNSWGYAKSMGRSKYRGVSWKSDKSKWRSSLYHKGKRHELGFFKTEIEAHEAFQAKAKELKLYEY